MGLHRKIHHSLYLLHFEFGDINKFKLLIFIVNQLHFETVLYPTQCCLSSSKQQITIILKYLGSCRLPKESQEPIPIPKFPIH